MNNRIINKKKKEISNYNKMSSKRREAYVAVLKDRYCLSKAVKQIAEKIITIGAFVLTIVEAITAIAEKFILTKQLVSVNLANTYNQSQDLMVLALVMTLVGVVIYAIAALIEGKTEARLEYFKNQ